MLLCIYVDMTELSDDEIVRKCENIRERFELIIERRFPEHSYIFTGAGGEDLNKRGIDVLNRAEMGVAGYMSDESIIRGKYSVVFATGLNVKANQIYKFIDLLANCFGFVNNLTEADTYGSGKRPSGCVQVLKLRHDTIEYTHQYASVPTNNVGIGMPEAAQLLYNHKYYGIGFGYYQDLYELLYSIFKMKNLKLTKGDMTIAVDDWIKKYNKKNRPNKYTRVHT